MIPNLLGTEFRQLDHRVDPRDPGVMEYVKERGKNELAAVVYELNVMGRRVNESVENGRILHRRRWIAFYRVAFFVLCVSMYEEVWSIFCSLGKYAGR